MLPLLSTNVSADPVTINGTIVDGEGNPVNGVEVTATSSGSTVDDTSDAFGKFDLTLSSGTYTFSFTRAGFGLKSTFGVLDENNQLTISGTEGTVTLNVVMGEAFGYLSGYVKNTNGDGLGNVTVSVMQGNKVIAHTITDGDGHYVFDKSGGNRILTGIYSVNVVRSDHTEQTKDNVEIKEDQTTFLDFVLESKTDSYLLGMDLPHSLMLGGVVLGLLMVIAVAVHRRRLGQQLLEPEQEDEIIP